MRLGILLLLFAVTNVLSPMDGKPQGGGRGGLLVAANKGDRTLSIVDPEKGQELALVPVNGVTGHEVAASPDGAAAYISCDRSRKIAVLDLKSWKIGRLIDAGAGVDGLAWAAGEK